jgi:hypothetical protein
VRRVFASGEVDAGEEDRVDSRYDDSEVFEHLEDDVVFWCVGECREGCLYEYVRYVSYVGGGGYARVDWAES